MSIVPQVFNKPTAAVHIRNGYTATERKLINICLYEGVQDNFSSDLYHVDVSETLVLIGCDKTKNSAWLKNELFEALRQKSIRWNIFNKDRGLQEWTCSFLAGYVAEPEEGKLAFQFNPMIVKYFKERRLYSRLVIQIEAPIKSTHALSLYEFLNDELHRTKSDKKKIVMQLSDLRALFDIGENQYTAFKYLHDQAIKPAFAEVNQHTDISASYTNIRTGRKVSALEIHAARQRNFQLSFNLGSPSSAVAPQVGRESRQNDPVTRLLVLYGISESKALRLEGRVSRQQIIANLRYSLEQQQKGKVGNFPSFLVKAIEENYAPLPSPAETEAALKSAWTSFRMRQAEAWFKSLSLAEQTKLRKEFEHDCMIDPNDQFAKRKFQYEDGWNATWVQHKFREQVLMKLLKTPEETDFAAFSSWWPEQELKAMVAEAENTIGKASKRLIA